VQNINGKIQAGAMVEDYFDCLYIAAVSVTDNYNIIRLIGLGRQINE